MAFLLLAAAVACGGSSPTSPSANAAPRVLYVSPSGSDQNDGSFGAPWLTLRQGVSQLHAGDTLYLRGGIYTGAANTMDSELATVPSGTSWGNVVTIGGYPGETATIRPPDGRHGVRLTTGAPRYIVFQDVIIDMSAHAGNADSAADGVYLSGGANHNRFLRVEIKNSLNFGLVFSRNNGAAVFNEVLNSKIHDNGLPGGNALNGHGLYISTSDNRIESNEVYNNQGYGIDLYDNEGSLSVHRNIVRQNRIYNNGLHGGTAYGIAVAWGAGNIISGNEIWSNPGGVLIYTNSANARVTANRIYSNTPLPGIFIQYATDTVVEDNHLSGNGAGIQDLGNGTRMSGNSGQ